MAATAFLASLSATAATNVNGIYYTFSGTEAAVTYASSSYNSYSGDVVIPSTVTYGSTTYTVTAINIRAFKDCAGLTSVTIPTTPPTCGEYCFDYSYASTNATLYVPVGTKAVYSSTSPWSDFINIVEDDSGSVEAVAEDEVAVTAVNGEIVISGADGQYVAVYTTAGQMVYSGYGNTVAVPSSGIYIVKVGASTFKLRL